MRLTETHATRTHLLTIARCDRILLITARCDRIYRSQPDAIAFRDHS
ncbi:MAG: hypothetical protein F6J98_38910 [Moorea sp. SIO4G2]|nr:hypothetical protein [Moorena sp. SIO4G2]